MWLLRRIARLARDERGQGLAEYALILGLVAVVAILALMTVGTDIRDMVFHTIGDTLGDVL
jgi:pilus assembly protein Flp/PilA